MDIERDLGPQPIAGILEQLGLAASDLVAASGEQLTHKMVARALKGRRLTSKAMGKVVRALNRASGGDYAEGALFTYSPRNERFAERNGPTSAGESAEPEPGPE